MKEKIEIELLKAQSLELNKKILELEGEIKARGKFDFERFKDRKLAVNCKTEADARIFLAYLIGKGVKWISGTPLICTLWNDYKDKTIYSLAPQGLIYGEPSDYDYDSCAIIEFDFMELK